MAYSLGFVYKRSALISYVCSYSYIYGGMTDLLSMPLYLLVLIDTVQSMRFWEILVITYI